MINNSSIISLLSHDMHQLLFEMNDFSKPLFWFHQIICDFIYYYYYLSTDNAHCKSNCFKRM